MLHLCCSVVLFLIVQTLSHGAPSPTPDISAAAGYLSRYGYLTQQNNALTSQETLTDALRNFQAFAGLNVTGELDKSTLTLMATPRCGVLDLDVDAVDRNDTHVRRKRYEIQGSRWRIRSITYRVSKYPRRLSREKVDDAIRRALEMWSNHTDLEFTRWSGDDSRVHIDIRFETGDHGDWDQFDGPDGTLAHAFFPRFGGAVHFDDDENWTVGDDDSGPNLFQIAVHELGHSLGLHHSELSQAVMGPYYKDFMSDFRLHQDDIDGITYLYGPAVSNRVKLRNSTDASHNLCVEPKLDAMFTDKNGAVFAFRGDLYYRLTDSGVAPGYPKRISETWVGLPGSIDAAFIYRNGKTFFFKGPLYWRFSGTIMDEAYPKLIASGFAGIPNDLDAVIEWTGNGKVYFFKGDQFWMFNASRRPFVPPRYPKPLSNWLGIPNNIDAALAHNKHTYFFKGNKYYRFNDRGFRVDDGVPPFPRSTTDWWFGCRKKSRSHMVTD